MYFLLNLFFSSSLQFSAAPLAPPGGPHFENHWLGTKTEKNQLACGQKKKNQPDGINTVIFAIKATVQCGKVTRNNTLKEKLKNERKSLWLQYIMSHQSLAGESVFLRKGEAR